MLFQNTIQKTMPLILGFAIVAFAGQVHAAKLPKGVDAVKVGWSNYFFDCNPDRLKKNQTATCRGRIPTTETTDARSADGKKSYKLKYKLSSCKPAVVRNTANVKLGKSSLKPGKSSSIQVKANVNNTWVGSTNAFMGRVASPIYARCKSTYTGVAK